MKATRLIFVMALSLSLLSLQGFAVNPESNSKPIKAVLEFYPNYAGHLLGVARIGYDSPYADNYQYSVRAEDLAYLKEHADLLEWSEGDEGLLSYFFITFPGYVNPSSKQELEEYLTDLNSAVSVKSFDEFKTKYQPYINDLDLWLGFNENEKIFNYSEDIQSISKILMNNYDSFNAQVWPQHKDYMQKLAELMNERFVEWDLITKWEKITGLEYKALEYRVVLGTGLANGPSGKALGYDKDWYYYGGEPKDMMQNICRETGLRVLSGLCSDKYEDYNPNLCFEVYQTLSLYLTDQIFSDLGLDEKIKNNEFVNVQLYSIFDLLMTVNPDLKINDLYAIAVDTYSRTNSFVSNKLD